MGKPVNALVSYLAQTSQSFLAVLHQGKLDRALWVLRLLAADPASSLRSQQLSDHADRTLCESGRCIFPRC